MQGSIVYNIELETMKNQHYRNVIHTGPYSQTVLMSLPPGADIPLETHDGDQFIRIEHGSGVVVFDNVPYEFSDGFALNITAGTHHYIKNTGNVDLKLYSIYTPPEHSPTLMQDIDMKTGQLIVLSK